MIDHRVLRKRTGSVQTVLSKLASSLSAASAYSQASSDRNLTFYGNLLDSSIWSVGDLYADLRR